MDAITTTTIYLKQTRFFILLVGLLWAGGQLNAQQATKVDIRVVNETFDTYGFTGDYVLDYPFSFTGLEFLKQIDFDYYTADGGQMADIDDACIITVNSDRVGHGTVGQYPHPDHTTGSGFYLFAVGKAGIYDRTIYYTTVAATKGEVFTFSVWIKNVDTGYNMRLEANGANLGTIAGTSFAESNPDWIKYTLTVTATATEDITFKVIDMFGYGDGKHKFGLDDITVTVNRKAIQLLTPTAIQATPGTNVSLSAKYYNPDQGSDSYSYKWQVNEGDSWVDLTDPTEPESGKECTTDAVNVTSNAKGFVNYRLVFTDGSKTYYSDLITVEYTATEYIFREDFGGNWVSTYGENPSGDWWITTGDQPDITTDYRYGPADNIGHDNRGEAQTAYGTIPIKLDNEYPSYAITKIAGWNLPLPGGDVWAWGQGGVGNEGGQKKGAFYDHTIPDDMSKGYFMYSLNTTGSLMTVYETSVSVTEDMKGQSFAFSAWQVALWGNSTNYNETYGGQFRLEILDAGNVVMKTLTFGVSDGWEERELLFFIPDNYSGDTIKMRISAIGAPLWLGLDDISLTQFNSSVAITVPSSGSSVGANADLRVNYQYVTSSVYYKWQISANGSTGWTDIPDSEGTGSDGSFIARIYNVIDSYYYRVVIADGDDFDHAIVSEPVQLFRITDYLIKEDFGGCNAATDFLSEAETVYTIPGYGYSEINAEGNPNPGGASFLITRKVYLHDGIDYWYDTVSNHSECNDGYFLQIHAVKPEEGEVMTFYETTLYDLCPGSKLSFHAWIANLGIHDSSVLDFKFLVSFNNDKTEEVTTGTINGAKPNWVQYGLDIYVPEGATSATFSILSEGGEWDWGRGFALDDIEIKKLNPVQLLAPDVAETYILSGRTVNLSGTYACGELTGTINYQWQKRTNGKWANCTGTGASGTYVGISSYTTEGITETTYFRLKVSDSSSKTLVSAEIKIIPQSLEESITIFVCPDNMTDGQAKSYRGGEGTYHAGMVSLEEPGYLPSLIRMEIPELTGITYKWYDSEEATERLPDLDEYDREQIYTSEEEVKDPIMLSDGKSHTFSVQNERNPEGVFIERTYWIEVCDEDGTPLEGIERIPYHLKPGYLCGKVKDGISADEARRIHREDFGGTGATDPEVMTDPPQGITIGYNQYTVADETLPEGGYIFIKEAPSLNNTWYKMTDHIYDDQEEEETHGYLVAVNATEQRGLFYTHELTNIGDCRDIELVFTGWFASPVKWNGYEKANLKFSLTDTDTGLILAEYLTGNMVDEEGQWRQFGFRFFVPDGVNSITLDIVNNNFGTSGGNDVVMDDIEIYLVVPPISMWPLEDGYVCDLGEGQGGALTLEARYKDDGTLGNELSYRWEYSSVGKNGPWETIGGGSVTKGVLTTDESRLRIYPFTTDNTGAYRIVIGPTGIFDTMNYECMAVSVARMLTYALDVEDPPTPSLAGNQTAFCYSDADDDGYITITNQDPNATNYKDYIWWVGMTVVSDSDNATESTLKLKLADYEPGYYQVSLTAINATECDSTSVHGFVLFPRETTWTGKGELNNWNDFRNWDNGVPGDCTHVIISKNKDEKDNTTMSHYPELIQPTVETLNINSYKENQINLNLQQAKQNDDKFSLRPACDIITFKMGGEVARTDYLNYRIAEVDLDIKPNRWYTLSAPLRVIYSGDYFVEGSKKRQNPAVYMMKYNSTNPQTGDTPVLQTGDFSNPFNTLSERLYPGLGYAIWVDDGAETEKTQSFRFPKDSTIYSLWNYQGVNMGKTGVLDRTNIGRFTYEEHIEMNGNLPAGDYNTTFTVDVIDDEATYTTALVGNPFMAHLDFTKFKAANSSITDGYYIWTSNDTYEAYKPGTFSDDPNLIAPMQSFIVEKEGELSSLQFDFNMSTTTPTLSLRTKSVGHSMEAALRMEVVRDQVAHSSIRLRYDPQEENAYQPHKDMWTLFSEERTEPAVLYTLLEGKAASIHTLGDLSKPIELGIRTDVKGELTLRLSGMETWDISQDIYLEDSSTGALQDMRENPEYTFDNTTGAVRSRLFLRIGKIVEDSVDPESDIRISSRQGQIMVNSPIDDPIETIKIHAISGQLLYHIRTIRKNAITFNAPIRKQVALITVTTCNQQKTFKVFVD
ncbi:hypothetical protein LJC35_06060 [Parabacteroides sp. OttesenSCG-928-N08]|nr:hypothetical protein [Parabacteroides sp. OttesenSCG-928-N08]